MDAIVITDSPRIVALKHEFAALDAEDVALAARQAQLRRRKLEIAQEVFAADSQPPVASKPSEDGSTLNSQPS